MFSIISRHVAGKMNFYSDQEGIISRYINEKENWDPHLANCKNYLISCLENKPVKTVSVLGSGWLLDVPVEFMADNFTKIYLYDIRHPSQVIHKLSRYSCFELVTADITGGFANNIFELVKKFKKTKSKPDPESLNYPVFKYQYESDYYISLNILNQLDILLADYLKTSGMYTESELIPFRAGIQNAHIKCLPERKSCIISDYEEFIYDKNDKLIERKNLLYAKFNSPENVKKWQWVFDTTGNYNKNNKTVFNVVAQEL